MRSDACKRKRKAAASVYTLQNKFQYRIFSRDFLQIINDDISLKEQRVNKRILKTKKQ